MARIRTIKPEFPQSESMGRVSRDARLCFILLWTIADDGGRLRGNSRMLASLLYPYDDDAPALIEAWLQELEREACIVRYQVDGTSYLEIAKWLSHQKIDRPSPSKFPGPDEGSRILASPREPSALDQGPRTKDQGEEGKGKDHDALRARREQVAAVFDHWRTVMNHPKAVLDDKRRKLIEARLKDGYGVADLMAAVTGCSLSPYHMGQNDNGTRYDGIDLICRDGSKVDKFIAISRNPPKPVGKQGQIEAHNQAAVDEFVNGGPPPSQWDQSGVVDAEVRHG